jgi:hypothetical protein
MFNVNHYGYLFEQTITRQTCLIGQQCQVNVHVYRLLELKNRGKQKLCSALDVEIGARDRSRAPAETGIMNCRLGLPASFLAGCIFLPKTDTDSCLIRTPILAESGH